MPSKWIRYLGGAVARAVEEVMANGGNYLRFSTWEAPQGANETRRGDQGGNKNQTYVTTVRT